MKKSAMDVASPGLSEFFDKRATIVAPTPLLASVITQQLIDYQLKRGLETWERPAIYTVDAWLSTCWQEARYRSLEVPSLLSPAQELLLWQQFIEQHHATLFDITATAQMARRSAQQIAEWHIPTDGDFWTDQQDAYQFQQWHKSFKSRCLKENWITRADLWRLLPRWISEGILSPQEIIFVGFDVPTPALNKIVQAFGGTTLSFRQTAAKRKSAVLKQCTEFPAEIEEAARWARYQFEASPNSSLGVFVPNLVEHRQLIERTFRNVFYPAAALQFSPQENTSIFHINAAGPALHEPLVAHALLLAELAYPRIDLATAGSILRSPFIRGAALERDQRALADVYLRSKRDLDVPLKEMEWVSRDCQHLGPVWKALRRLLSSQPQEAELPAWSKFMGDLIEATGWPGEQDLTAREQELVDAWQNALSGLASLGLVSSPVSYKTALFYLRRLLSNPGSEVGSWSSPIQILDASESAGLSFDQAFLVGLSEDNWPPRLSLSPLIPLPLQRASGIPGSTPESYRSFAERTTRNLFSTASTIAGTYSDRLSPSAVSYKKSGSSEGPRWMGSLPLQAYKPQSLECLTDTNAPPYRITEHSRGGTSILRAQSACPFRAFAEMRLHAQSLEEACFGFDARDRGGFLHKALELVWRKIETQEKLRSLSPEEQEELIQVALDEAILNRDHDNEFRRQITAAERERLAEVIQDWLALEYQRLQPFTVQTLEQECFLDIAGMRLKLRIDRIDQLANGNLLLIDYKSGEQNRKKLLGDRPEEPQLLVYASALGEQVEGLFFGQLKPRDLKPVGFSRDPHFHSKDMEVLGNQWVDQVATWRETVERIGQQFVEGYAAIHPQPTACNYCDIKPLCRIQERLADATEE